MVCPGFRSFVSLLSDLLSLASVLLLYGMHPAVLLQLDSRLEINELTAEY